ncbi:MAG TPA: sortase [Aeromicrobium sp.]|nr:sortase [Aeromicrobium sp.]
MTQTATRTESLVRKVLRTIGILMIAVGLGIMGWFAWQYWGTNVVSHQKQQKILDDWTNSEAIGILRVPRFGPHYQVPIIPGGNLVDPKGVAALGKGVAWYEPGARPGQIGNFVVAGHRVTHGEPFKDFPKLKAGDKINVETRDAYYTYVLRNGGTEIVVPFTASWPLHSVPDPNLTAGISPDPTEAVMTMVTCSELFHTDNRSVVIGDLTFKKSK